MFGVVSPGPVGVAGWPGVEADGVGVGVSSHGVVGVGVGVDDSGVVGVGVEVVGVGVFGVDSGVLGFGLSTTTVWAASSLSRC